MDIDNKQKLLIEMIMRQTMYTYDQAKDKLEENDNNYMLVIKKALGIVEKPPTSVPSINQGIYKEIRGLMDTVSTNHRENQEKEREREENKKSLKKKTTGTTETGTTETGTTETGTTETGTTE